MKNGHVKMATSQFQRSLTYFFGVDLLVLLEVRARREGLLADLAAEGFVARVDSLMPNQI